MGKGVCSNSNATETQEKRSIVSKLRLRLRTKSGVLDLGPQNLGVARRREVHGLVQRISAYLKNADNMLFMDMFYREGLKCPGISIM